LLEIASRSGIPQGYPYLPWENTHDDPCWKQTLRPRSPDQGPPLQNTVKRATVSLFNCLSAKALPKSIRTISIPAVSSAPSSVSARSSAARRVITPLGGQGPGQGPPASGPASREADGPGGETSCGCNGKYVTAFCHGIGRRGLIASDAPGEVRRAFLPFRPPPAPPPPPPPETIGVYILFATLLGLALASSLAEWRLAGRWPHRSPTGPWAFGPSLGCVGHLTYLVAPSLANIPQSVWATIGSSWSSPLACSRLGRRPLLQEKSEIGGSGPAVITRALPASCW